MSLSLIYSAEARNDLIELATYIGDTVDDAVAQAFIARLTALCEGLPAFPHRGTRRDDLSSGVRSYGWRKRATIIFRIKADTVFIIGVFYKGRDIDAALAERDFDV